MTINAIDSTRIQAMLEQLKTAAQKPAVDTTTAAGSALSKVQQPKSAPKVDFAEALKSSLNQVNQMQVDSENLSKNFAMGDDKVSLSDVMITGQKANIAFQATIQVRNKLVSAYHDIMNMPV